MFRKVKKYFSSESSQEERRVQSEVRNLNVLLEKHYNGPVQILSEEILQVAVPVASPFRLELKLKIKLMKTGKTEKVNLFVKLFDQDDEVDIRIDLLVRFKKEIEAYTTTIPVMAEFQREYLVEEEKLYDKLFPKCIATRISMLDENKKIPDNTAAIVLENLRIEGYQLEDLNGFDFATTKIAVENLARFHAVPLALRILNLDIFREKVIPSMVELKEFEKKPDYYKDINDLINFGVEGHPELAPYLDSIYGAIEYSKFNSWFRKSYSDQTWVTMCHTKYWILNIMIKRNQMRKPVASKMVDLQKFEYLPCCADLAFFMFTIVRKETLEISFDDILRAYFDAFTETLGIHQIFITPYNYETFFEEFNIQGPKMLVEILENLKYIACEGYDVHGEPVIGPKYKRKVRDILLLMINRGWMEMED